jgi:hypothetical protein
MLTVESAVPGVPRHLHEATHNFSSLTTRRALAKELEERSRVQLPWRDYVENFCVSVCRREREGEPLLPLASWPDEQRPADHIEHLAPYGVSTWLFGEEGSCKGHVAIAAAVCVAAGQPFAGLKTRQSNVAYLDWEDSPEEAKFRARGVCAGLGITLPHILYRNCRRGGPLRAQVNSLAKQLDAENVGFIVVDSVGLASGSSREGAGVEEAAIALHDALNVLGRTALCIDHLSKAEARNPNGPAKAYGSIYKLALARQSWELRKDQDDGASEAHIGLFWGKSNRGTRRPPIGLKLAWRDDGSRLEMEREDVRDSPELSQRLSVKQRMIHILTREAMIDEAIAEDLGVPLASVRVELSRNKHLFRRHPEDSRFWTVIERQQATGNRQQG